jgi:ribosomal protein L15
MRKVGETPFDKFDAAMDTILKADPAQVKAGMDADKKSRSNARLRRLAKKVTGPPQMFGTGKLSVPMQVLSEEFQKSARRKVN